MLNLSDLLLIVLIDEVVPLIFVAFHITKYVLDSPTSPFFLLTRRIIFSCSTILSFRSLILMCEGKILVVVLIILILV